MMLVTSAPVARDQLSNAAITCCPASDGLAASAFVCMSLQWLRRRASLLIKLFPAFTFSLNVWIWAERDDHNLPSGSKTIRSLNQSATTTAVSTIKNCWRFSVFIVLLRFHIGSQT